MNPKLQPYIPLVEFISRIAGPDCEVVLHDVSDLEHSVIAISDCNLTGRKIGDAVTDMALRVLSLDQYQHVPYLVNYKGKAKSINTGETLNFRSSTYMIRDGEEVIGLLCVNINTAVYTRLHECINALEMLNAMHDIDQDNGHNVEHFTTDADDLFNACVARAQHHYGDLSSTTKSNRQQFVKELDENGLFNVKGSIARAAKVLHVSEQTVYRYISDNRKKPGNCK